MSNHAIVTRHISHVVLKVRRRLVEDGNVAHDRTGDPAFSRAIDAARLGQAPGFEWLWNRFSRQVCAFAAARGSGDSEGVANEVFLGAFRRIDTFFGNEDAFVALLFSITRNKLVDEHRKGSRQVATRELSSHDDRHGGDAEIDALQQLDVDAVAMLDGLTDDQKEVLYLRLIADLSLEQTAVVTRRSVNAVKALQHRATLSLRRTISEEAVTK